jgi:glycosyltransferase involved in cell wall biosynthesis
VELDFNVSETQLGVIIPAFNPDILILEELLTRISVVLKNFKFKVMVIDDGSTPPISLSNFIKDEIRILRHAQNSGKGTALKRGFQYFIQDHPCDLVITLDADLQHPPELIPNFIKRFKTGCGDVIIGYRRRLLFVMPVHRIISNTFTSLIVSSLIGQYVRDSQCGFRLIKTSILQQNKLSEHGFHLETELLIKAGWQKIKIGFVPIPTIYNKEKSSINNLSDTLNFISLILRLLKQRIFN